MWSHIFLFGSLPRRRPPAFTAILMFEFWREATATSVPGLLCQSGRRRPENVSILSSLLHDDGNGNGNVRKDNSFRPCPHQCVFKSIVFIFVVIEDTSMDSCPHYRFDVFSTVYTKTFKTMKLHVETQVQLFAHATKTRACDISGNRFHFEAFSTVFDRPR